MTIVIHNIFLIDEIEIMEMRVVNGIDTHELRGSQMEVDYVKKIIEDVELGKGKEEYILRMGYYLKLGVRGLMY